MAEYKRHVGKHHGYYGTPTYKSWYCMKYRCWKKGTPWERISYCNEWTDFRNFLRDMGERPNGTSLDRINPYGNYYKENCRWADILTQENNKTSNRYFLYNGEQLTLSQIARKYNVSRSNLANKIYIKKESIENAMNYLILKKFGR